MMTIKDLAERWGVTLPQAKRIVRDEGVPFVALRAFDMRINWRLVRFTAEAVAAWEDARVQVAGGGEPDPDAVAPATVVHRILDGHDRRRARPSAASAR